MLSSITYSKSSFHMLGSSYYVHVACYVIYNLNVHAHSYDVLFYQSTYTLDKNWTI